MFLTWGSIALDHKCAFKIDPFAQALHIRIQKQTNNHAPEVRSGLPIYPITQSATADFMVAPMTAPHNNLTLPKANKADTAMTA